MNSLTLLAIIALAALIHTSFQLSVSVLTLVSGHAIGGKARHRQVMHLMSSFTLGAMAMVALLLSTIAFGAFIMFGTNVQPIAWATASGLLAGVGVAVWVFYYRQSTGTALWIPRSQVRMLHGRIKATESGAEAFSLGLTSVIIEVIFTAAPLAIAAFAILSLPHYLQFAAVVGYVIIATAPLLVMVGLVGGGHRISAIQRWREQNRTFIQMAAGTASFILAAYIYVNIVLTPLWLQGAQ